MSETLLSELASRNKTGNVIHDIQNLKLDFDALCDSSTRWDPDKHKCVSHDTRELCASGSEVIAYLCSAQKPNEKKEETPSSVLKLNDTSETYRKHLSEISKKAIEKINK